MMLRLFAGAAWWSVGLQRGRHWVAHSASEVLSSAMSLNKSSSPEQGGRTWRNLKFSNLTQ